MLRADISMLRPSDFESGLYKYDGNGILADIDKNELVKGAYIKQVKFFDAKCVLQITMSNGTIFTIENFVKIDEMLDAEALLKRGYTGVNGRNGLNGADGKNGVQGERGDVGPNGAPGVKGFRGDKGPKGLYGPKGLIGVSGETGLVGLVGVQGDQGNRGQQGDAGKNGYSNVLASRYAPDKESYANIDTPIWIETSDVVVKNVSI